MKKCGICICGLNGSGKTTLARALAKELNYKHMDAEEYYFSPTDNPYSSSRTREEAERLIREDIQHHPCFVFSSVSGNMTSEINAHYDLIVYLDVPLEIRMKRIRQRAWNQFGNRILIGGDLHEQEEQFFAFVQSRTPDKIENWLKTVSCRVIRLDGTKLIHENVQAIKELLSQQNA